MYRLHQTDDLASAARLNFRLLEADPDATPTLVIVQSLHMQRWLSRLLARERGIWFQPDFATPDGGLRRLLQDMKTPDGTKPRHTLFMDDLKYLSYRSLSRAAARPDFMDEFPLLARLLDPEASQSQQFSRQRLYEMADSISGLFYNYAMLLWSTESNRIADTHLFSLWESGRNLLGQAQTRIVQNSIEENLTAHETWQKKLFGLMFPPNRAYEILGYQTHLAAAEAWTYQGPCRRIVLFGSTFLSTQAFAFFQMLSDSGMEINHILLTPSPELLVGNPDATGQLGDWSALLKPFLEAANLAGIVPTSQFSRQGFSANYVAAPAGSESPLVILRNVLDNQPNIDLQNFAPASMWPHSGFRCFSCTTPLREVESLKQNLLALIAAQSESDQPLLPQDIAIMAPDIRVYRPYLETCFPALSIEGKFLPDHLPINLVDLDFGGNSSTVTALESLLTLPESRLERSFVLELLDNPAIRASMRVDADAVKTFRDWTEAYAVRWGLNADHRQELETGNSWSNTWDRALSRLFEDLAQGKRHAGAAELAAIGRIAEYLHRTSLTLRAWSHSQKLLKDWVHGLQDFIDQSITAPDAAEARILDQARSAASNLLQIAEDLGDQGAVRDELDWIGFRTLYRDQLAHLSGSYGQHQIDGITCSSLRPFRAISFRMIALLGMNEGDLPRRDESISFDLARLEERNRGLINNRLTDNYAWLETISSAREWLWAFYTGRDPYNSELLEPAPMVKETLAVLQKAGIPAGRLLVHEPILGFDPTYFSSAANDRGLVNSNPKHLQAARSLANPVGLATVTTRKSPFLATVGQADKNFLHGKDGDGLRVSFKELVDFVRNPVRSHVQRRLGIQLDQVAAESDQDHESLDPSAWLAANAVADLAGQLLGRTASESSLAAATIERECAADRLFSGPFAHRAQTQLAVSLGLAEPALEQLAESQNHKLNLEGCDLDQEITIILDLPAPDLTGLAGPFRIRIGGRMRQIWQLGDNTVWTTISGGSAYKTPSDLDMTKFLELAIGRAICRACNLPVPQEFINISINPKTDAAKVLYQKEITDLGEQELDLTTLLQAWLVNLIHPLPFYLDLTEKIIKPLAQDIQKGEAHANGNAGRLREAWNNAWPALLPVQDFPGHVDYGPATNPRSCPYFRILTGNSDTEPPWVEWYAQLLESVWVPLWQRRGNFVKVRGGAKKDVSS